MTVWIKRNNRWYWTDTGVNQTYAECVKEYLEERGVEVIIAEEDQE